VWPSRSSLATTLLPYPHTKLSNRMHSVSEVRPAAYLSYLCGLLPVEAGPSLTSSDAENLLQVVLHTSAGRHTVDLIPYSSINSLDSEVYRSLPTPRTCRHGDTSLPKCLRVRPRSPGITLLPGASGLTDRLAAVDAVHKLLF
jgi:hypothetical protein